MCWRLCCWEKTKEDILKFQKKSKENIRDSKDSWQRTIRTTTQNEHNKYPDLSLSLSPSLFLSQTQCKDHSQGQRERGKKEKKCVCTPNATTQNAYDDVTYVYDDVTYVCMMMWHKCVCWCDICVWWCDISVYAHLMQQHKPRKISMTTWKKPEKKLYMRT